ncbi:MAG TPA: hypothetical protein VKF79_05220 [Candidatus Acidoferrum sp.]|nr:hypothetical protein [Candidatus Acidoferrum sp.]
MGERSDDNKKRHLMRVETAKGGWNWRLTETEAFQGETFEPV